DQDREQIRPVVPSPISSGSTESEQTLPDHESVDDVRSPVGAWHQESEPLLFRSTRQILSANPSYAEEIIETVKQMPEYRHILLLSSKQGNRFLDDPADDPGATNTASGDQGKGSSGASGQKSKKRRRQQDEEEDQDDLLEDGDHDGEGEEICPRKKRDTKNDERWACPYSRVYPEMLEINKFSTCRPPGSLKERSEWRLHLERRHSPNAKLKDSVEEYSIFYMDDQQWKEVQDIIKSSDLTRPREDEPRRAVKLDCYLAVWHVIFPASQFPREPAPISPFHPDSQQIQNLGLQGQVMFDAIWKVRAKPSIASGSIRSEQDYQPTRDDLRSIVAEMFAIVTNSSPGASQWVCNTTPKILQDLATSSAQDSHQASTAFEDPSSCIVDADMVAEHTEDPSSTERLQDERGFASSSTSDAVIYDTHQSSIQATPSNFPQVNQLPAYMPVTVMMLPESYTQFTTPSRKPIHLLVAALMNHPLNGSFPPVFEIPQVNQLPAYMSVTVMMLPGSYTQLATPSLNSIHLLVAAPMDHSLDGSFPTVFEIPQTPAQVTQFGLQGLPIQFSHDGIPVRDSQGVIRPGLEEAVLPGQNLDFGEFPNEPSLGIDT
ncbi:hypothetical protein ACHAQD_006505, partial [Fusarium lateritium]